MRPKSSLAPVACLAALFALCALSSGCTSLPEYFRNGFKVGPNYAKPPAPVAKEWIDAADKRVRSESDDLSKWWTVFNDPVARFAGLFRVPAKPDVARGGVPRAGSAGPAGH